MPEQPIIYLLALFTYCRSKDMDFYATRTEYDKLNPVLAGTINTIGSKLSLYSILGTLFVIEAVRFYQATIISVPLVIIGLFLVAYSFQQVLFALEIWAHSSAGRFNKGFPDRVSAINKRRYWFY